MSLRFIDNVYLPNGPQGPLWGKFDKLHTTSQTKHNEINARQMKGCLAVPWPVCKTVYPGSIPGVASSSFDAGPAATVAVSALGALVADARARCTVSKSTAVIDGH